VEKHRDFLPIPGAEQIYTVETWRFQD